MIIEYRMPHPTTIMDVLFSALAFATVVLLMLSMTSNVKSNRNGNVVDIYMNWGVMKIMPLTPSLLANKVKNKC